MQLQLLIVYGIQLSLICCQAHLPTCFLNLLQCFFPAELIKSISTPTFIVNSEYDSWQVIAILLIAPSTCQFGSILVPNCCKYAYTFQIQNVVAPVGSYPGDTWSNCRDNIGNCSSKQIDVLHGQPSLSISSVFSIQSVLSVLFPLTTNVFFFGRVLQDSEGNSSMS